MNARHPPALFQPAIEPGDPLARRWLSEVTLRLRREIAWCGQRREAALAPGAAAAAPPPPPDAAQDSLDGLRFAADKAHFMATDVTAAHLGRCIAGLHAAPGPSRWHGVVQALALDEAAQFVLACALAARADATLGAVAAAALNDLQQPHLSLALAQRLWDDPLAIVACAEPTHLLYRSGLLRAPAARDAHGDWSAPLDMPAVVARVLLADPRAAALPAALRALPAGGELPAAALALASWLRATPVEAMQIVPVQAPRGADTVAWVAALGTAAGSRIARLADDITPTHPALPALACAAWLHGAELLAPEHWAERDAHLQADDWLAPLTAIPVRWYVPTDGAGAARGWQSALVAPAFKVPALSTAERTQRLTRAAAAGLDAAGVPRTRAGKAERAQAAADAAEAARRYRLQSHAVGRLEAVLRSGAGRGRDALFALAQGEAMLDLAQLAQPVDLRFELDDLVLPAAQRAQLQAIVTGMRTLGRVHHEWGCARVWNEAGLAILFCGPPGTGKTMAAEALASELGLPMYRIDLSQVVNKYIGETEKNLRRIFDAAEASDCLLFFDEADALFGKRTEVRDAHDRYANIEVSYLLERMERFKGLAVLATNRRKDLDEAFGRRLRYVVEFPVPGAAERARIWRRVFPPVVDVKGIDFAFLAERFELAGGAIRSAAFNACLQAAAREAQARVAMGDVLTAVKRELEKGGREVAAEQFGRYAAMLEAQA